MRNRQGQYETRDRHDTSDKQGEQLERIVQFRIKGNEYRLADVMFSQHRGQFGWETMSDMYRHALKTGIMSIAADVKKPTRDMITQIEQSKEIDKVTSEAMRHRDLERLFDGIEESIGVLTRAGDLGAIREMLRDFQGHSKRITDRALRYRREMEFDRRWGRLWDELNRGADLPIDG